MWTSGDYVFALLVIFILFIGISYLIAKKIKRPIVIAEFLTPSNLIGLFALITATIFFISPKWSEEKEFNQNLLAINCINFALASELTNAGGAGWQNDRYITKFYENNWSEILRGLSSEDKTAYGLLTVHMNRGNIILDRAPIETVLGGESALKKDNYEVVELAGFILEQFQKIKITNASCSDIQAF